MSWQYKLAGCGIFFPCIASIVQSFAPLWVFMALIVTGMSFTAVGLVLAQRNAKRQELLWKMEKALGKPKPKFGDR